MNQFTCVFCDQKFPADPMSQFCPDCIEPLLVHLPAQPRHIHFEQSNPLEKYLDFLPITEVDTSIQLGEGNSPLLRLTRLEKSLKLPQTLAKNEIFNPTGSFKDRGTVLAIHIARSLDYNKIGTVSTGNMGSSTAAYGARAGIGTFVLVKEDTTTEKLLSAGIHNPTLIRVKGDYGDLLHTSFKIGKNQDIYFMNSTDPFRIEGYKITGFEIFDQMNQSCPTHIFVPVSSGGHLIGLMKAFFELKQQGLTKTLPKFIGVQAQGCSPIAKAFAAGKPKYERIHDPATIAQSITNPKPPGGNVALKMIRQFMGKIISVSDAEILNAQRLLAEYEGIFCLPASATTLAGFLKLDKQQKFQSQDRIVLVITGSGVKNTQILDHSPLSIHNSTLDDLEGTILSLK